VRWGNVAQLAGLVAAVWLVAFGVPNGCGSEPEVIPLDALPGEPVETASPPPARVSAPGRFHRRPAATRPPRVQRGRRPRPPRGREGLGRGAPPRVAADPVFVPQAAREFSFDR
jgi:hypothetical protein